MAELSFQTVDLTGRKLAPPMTVRYAPVELAFTKTAQYADVAIPGLDQPLIQFVRGEAETLTLELFFDATEAGTGETAQSVTETVETFHKLATVQGNLHMPPLVQVSWGKDFPGTAMGETGKPLQQFTAVVLSVGRRFTLFSPEGKPLRAVVTLSLKHYATVAEQVAAINYRSPDHTRVHVVAEGETLPLIAHDAYADARAWRVIADHNDLADTRHLTPGAVLLLPPLTGAP